MKFMPYYLSFLGFVLPLSLFTVIGRTFQIDWLMFYYERKPSSGDISFEAGLSWIPIILSSLFGYLSWRLGKRKFPS